MNIFNFLRNTPKRTTASVAKERLQIIVSHESARRNDGQDFIKKLQQELLEVISKYVSVDREEIKVQMERNADQDVLELSVTLPDAATLASRERKDFSATAISQNAKSEDNQNTTTSKDQSGPTKSTSASNTGA